MQRRSNDLRSSAEAPLTTVWHRLDRFLARLRPHREPLSLLIDGAVVLHVKSGGYILNLVVFVRVLLARKNC